jgi:DNA-binding NtrC family response regulator/tetratricopeptide (TPR) repeat protein
MSGRMGPDAIIGDAEEIQSLRAQIARLAAFDSVGNPLVPTVLLLGETGTGKGLVARVVHDTGPRADGAFIDVNCAAIPEAMLEAELFGFEAGAFTDAKRSKPGLFEAASGGTLFLDEVDSLTLPVQSKVLKAIEEKRVRRLGAVAARDVDVKLIAATQRDLSALVVSGAFRADLYHRLAVLVLPIAPLRRRGGDALRLAAHYLSSYAGGYGLAPKRLDDAARAWIGAYPWPGNVRELAHLMERITLLCPDAVVTREALEAHVVGRPGGSGAETVSASPSVAPVEAAAADEGADEAHRIRSALARSGGNVVRAARLLGLGRNALRYRMRRLGIARPDATEDGGSTAAGLPAAGAPAATGAAAGATTVAAATPAWEQKTAAVLIVSVTLPDTGTVLEYEPWTAARHWQRAVVDRVDGFGGVVVERTPSRITAAFGIPRALEQSAERAAQAALAMGRAAAQAPPPRPELRTALHVGEVRIDASAADPTPSLVPIGDTFSMPERLLGHAGAGDVLVSPAAARRIGRSFELAPREIRLGPAPADRLTVHAIVRQQRQSTPPDAGDAPLRFIGRGRELDLLEDAFARATAGHGQVVFVSGEAGIGKSRLLAELHRRLDGRPHQWIEGRCASYGSSTPFLPLIDGLHRYFGIDDRDDDVHASAKIERTVVGFGADLDWTLPFLQQLLSLDVADDRIRALDSASRRSELFRALRALLLRAAEREPVVLVVEDLHWVDPASEEWLAFLADVVPTTRALLLVSFRTGYRPPLPERSYHHHIALPPLSGPDMAAITGALLGSAEIPSPLHALITEKAEGNPFFVEELVRSLIEDGALRCAEGQIEVARDLADLAVPDTVQDVLSARIDRLAEDARRAIQVAAVIGREFALRLLARISDAGDRVRGSVEELRSLELIYEKALHPELAYMFKHALTHDVAYESVVADRRRRLHLTIGRAIEDLYTDRLGEHYETLAHHFSRGEEWPRAMLYHERSAEKAAETHANRAVVHHCRAALDIAARLGAAADDAVRARLNERLGLALFYLSEFAASGAAFEEAAARTTDAHARALHFGNAAFSHFWAHRYDTARRCIDAAAAAAEAAASPSAGAFAGMITGFYVAVHDARVDEMERRATDGLAVCVGDPDDLVAAFGHYQLVMSSEWTGAYADALHHADRAIALGRALRRPDVIILASWFLAKARGCLGDYGGALALLDDAYAICDRIGDRAWKSRMLNTIGWCLAEIDCPERAHDYNERAGALAREIGDPEIRANAEINLAANHLALGDLGRAIAVIEPLEAVLARPGDPWMRWRYGLHVRDLRAAIELARGAPDAALQAVDHELHGARRHRAAKLEARALAMRGAALVALGRDSEGEQMLDQAIGLAERIGYLRGVWRAHVTFAEHLRRRGRTAPAAMHAHAARAAIERAAATLADADLRQRLLGTVPGAP